VLPVQSLHLPGFHRAWLGIGWPQKRLELSPTLSRSTAPFPSAAPNSIGILCSIRLSYVDLADLYQPSRQKSSEKCRRSAAPHQAAKAVSAIFTQ
jgi:hypothetical protein